MKIISLVLLSLLSTQAFAYDWQFSVKYPDGKSEVKQLSNTEDFMFPVKDYICSVNPYEPDDEEEYTDKFEITCLSKNGMYATINTPKHDKESETLNFWIPDEKGKDIKVEMIVFHKLPKNQKV